MKRGISLHWWYSLFVGLPTLLVALYYAFAATDMYVSEMRFSIRGTESVVSPELSAILHQGVVALIADAYVVQDYIISIDMLNKLEKRLDLNAHYQNPNADFYSRLKQHPTVEDFFAYYKKIVHIGFDPSTGIMILKCKAYTPEMARDLGLAVIDESEKLVNRTSDRALKDSLSLAQNELAVAERRVGNARQALKEFQHKNDLINPQATVGATLSLVADLEGEVAKARTKLAETLSFMREDSSHAGTLKARIVALEQQIENVKSRLTGKNNHVLNEVTTDFEKLVMEREFAEKQYVSALSSLELARIRAELKSRYLIAFAPPTLPEESTYPKRTGFTGLAFASLSLAFGIVSLLIAAIREHAGF